MNDVTTVTEDAAQPATPTLEAAWEAEGFQLWPSAGEYVPAVARIFARQEAEGITFRLLATQAHCNGGGIMHGGMLSTLADTWLANNLLTHLPPNTRMVTASLSVDFLRPVLPGQVLQSEMDRIRTGSRLCHATGVLLVEGEPVVAMRASFALFSRA